MSAAEWLVTLVGIAAIVWVNVHFLGAARGQGRSARGDGPKRKEED